MIIRKEDIEIAIKFFDSHPDHELAPIAGEMNRKHQILPLLMKTLEKAGIPGYIIDELMLGIIVVWYVIEKINYKRIEQITDIDVKKNIELFGTFTKYFNDSDDEEKANLHFFTREKDLLFYTGSILNKLYRNPEDIPKAMLVIYFSIMKCFEDKLEYTRQKNGS